MNEIIEKQRKFFATARTRDLTFRKNALKRLKNALVSKEDQILQALEKDLGKSAFEAVTTEIGMITGEINYMLKNLTRLQRPKRVSTNLFNLPGRSKIYREPRGTTLIIGPWNYPLQLALAPLVGAIAGGNTSVVKPSELSPHTSEVIVDIIADCFPPEYITTVQGGVAETQALLEQPFDMIFFTGSPAVGKIVMEKAASHLTPVVLELGGKSPCIIDETASLDVAVKRIVFGKAGNSGQTCVAPDYLVIHRSRIDEFVSAFQATVTHFYGEDVLASEAYGKMINERHYTRVKSYLDDGKILYGGNFDDIRHKIAPTLIEIGNREVSVMQDEIFGPILPLVIYEDESEIYSIIADHPDPLALYLFSSDNTRIRRIIERIPFGGGCINDTIMHLTNDHLPFGGRGNSGMGNYHGRRSFEAFTHEKSVFRNSTLFHLPLKYPPHGKGMLNLVKRLMY